MSEYSENLTVADVEAVLANGWSVTCNGCGWLGDEEGLIGTLDADDGEPCRACPTCGIDGNLMDTHPAAPDLHEAILALCDALDELRTESDQRIPYDEEFDTQYEVERNPCGAHMAIQDMQAENKRLQTIIGNLHAVEEKHRETANAHFHRANRLQAENERLRNFIADFSETKFDRIDRRSPDPQDDLDPLTDYLTIEAWQEDARAALAQKGGE